MTRLTGPRGAGRCSQVFAPPSFKVQKPCARPLFEQRPSTRVRLSASAFQNAVFRKTKISKSKGRFRCGGKTSALEAPFQYCL